MKKAEVLREPWWQRIDGASPGPATLAGLVVGVFAALLTYVPSFRQFPDAALLVAPFFGLGGYLIWLISDPVREERIRRMARPLSLVALATLVVLIPGEIWRFARTQPLWILPLLGSVSALAMMLIATGCAVIHFGSYVAGRTLGRRSSDPHDGLWDRELDQAP
jgi:hypothetical protein